MAEHRTVTISKLSPLGEGIAFDAGAEIYVPYALVGEKLEVEIGEPFAAGSKRRPGKIIKLLEPSYVRQEQVGCRHFAECGGCQLMHLKYEAQIQSKQQAITDAVAKALDNLQNTEQKAQLMSNLPQLIQPVVTMQNPLNHSSRSKSIRYFAQHPELGLQSGFFAPRSHSLVPIEDCVLEPEVFSTIALQLTQLLAQAGCKAYEDTLKEQVDLAVSKECLYQATSTEHAPQASKAASTEHLSQAASNGTLVRALIMRKGDDNQLLVCLLTASLLSDELKHQLKLFAQEHEITSLYTGLNIKAGNALFTDELELIAGQPWICKSILGQHFNVGPNTFLQVNYEMCEKLYATAVGHCAAQNLMTKDAENSEHVEHCSAGAESSGAESSVALDLCCGVGTMSLALARYFKHVIGVDIVENSIKAAEENAANNEQQVSFIAGDLSKILPSLIKPYAQKQVRAVIADPARVGIGEDNARLLSKIHGPCRISLIYCALNALQRELPVFLKGGFKIDKIQGFDMFPHSTHIETLVCLSKR